jgi:hypothetical protein
LLVHGEQRANAALAGELELDGYRVHRASQPRTLRERCKPGEVDLVIFGHEPYRGLDHELDHDAASANTRTVASNGHRSNKNQIVGETGSSWLC